MFETLRAYNGVVFRLSKHLERLARSMAAIRMALSLELEPLGSAIDELLAANRLREARVRLTVTGGISDGSLRLIRPGPPTVLITAFPIQTPTPEQYDHGVDLHVASFRQPWASPLARVKTIHRLEYLLAREEAAVKHGFDALILDDRGGLAEGSAGNVFLVTGGRVATPSLDGPLLPGVSRDAALESARRAGLPVEERFIPEDEVRTADEVFLTATSYEVLPVRSVDGRPVGRGRPGPMTARIHGEFRDLVGRETGGQG